VVSNIRIDGVPVSPKPEPDAHGQAALMLGESLLHMLVEKGLLTNTDAMDVVQTAAEVKAEVATASGESQARMLASLSLLSHIEASFESDDAWPGTPPGSLDRD